ALPIGYIGMPINLDTCYTDACHNLALQSVDCFCSPTDDPPTPRNSLNILHAAFYPFRSIENGVPSVRADTRAFSLITDRFGRIIALSQKQGGRAVLGSVDSEVRHTPYRRLGDSFAWGCAALTLLLLCGSAGHVYLDYRSNANAS
ncbi:MAG TPA: hypothetical protein VHR86_08240, partial [Armatimonadota bacterium]|nr:hypothetical protein [Armatimonadota bacterium]